MSYEVFEKKGRVTKPPKIIIQPKGIVWMNVDCVRRWFPGCPEVVLFFDKEQRKIGIKPAREKSENSYTIAPNGTISCTALFRKMGIIPLKKVCKLRWNDKEGFVEISV